MWLRLGSPYLRQKLARHFAPRPLSSALEPTGPSAIEAAETPETTILRTLGWLSAALGAVAVGLFVGRELRQRYHFHRRTPYDFYAHSGGDEVQDMEFGLGI